MKKLFTFLFLSFAGILTISKLSAQANAAINILAGNAGVIMQGQSENLQVTINNTGPTSSIGIYRVKVQISVPSAISSIPTTGHSLPAGWTILSNSGSQILLSNGTDIIPVGAARNIFIAIQGNATGGPSTIIGQLSFSNGAAPGSANGFLTGDIAADNSSSTAITVTEPTPVKLTNLNALLVNCQPVLNWNKQ